MRSKNGIRVLAFLTAFGAAGLCLAQSGTNATPPGPARASGG